MSPETLYAHINDNTSPVVTDSNSNSVTGNFVSTATTTTIAAEVVKGNESDSSNDGLEQQATTRTNGNNSDDASGYFTEEHVNTSVEDVSTPLPPVAMGYSSSSSSSSSQADVNSCDSDSNLELKLGLTDLTDDPVIDTTKMKLKTSNVIEMQAKRSDNVINPSKYHHAFLCSPNNQKKIFMSS